MFLYDPAWRATNAMSRVLGTGGLAAMLLMTPGGIAAPAAPQPAAASQTRTVWDGVYTDAQAARGATSFEANCVRCHGADLGGSDDGKALAGEDFWEGFQQKTVDRLFTYVRDNMPNGAGGTLSTSTYLDLVAFILSRNDLPAGGQELTEDSSVGVRIIPENGPGELPNSTLARVVGCLARGDDRDWLLTTATAPERIEQVGAGEADASRPLGVRTYRLMFVLTSLDRYVGHRMSVSGLLMGDGGADGINVSIVESVADSCP